jgi:hypothetical protein
MKERGVLLGRRERDELLGKVHSKYSKNGF